MNFKEGIFYLHIFTIILWNNASVLGEIKVLNNEETERVESNSIREKPHRFNYNYTSIANTLKSRRNKDKKSFINKKLKKVADAENLKEFIKQIDSSGLIRKMIRRKVYIPEDSSLGLSSQVSRPNIFPNIFNQGEGFIVDAVIEWTLSLDLHAFGEAMQMEKGKTDSEVNTTSSSSSPPVQQVPPVQPSPAQAPPVQPSTVQPPPAPTPTQAPPVQPSTVQTPPAQPPATQVAPEPAPGSAAETKGRSFSDDPSDIIGLERCLIYEKMESAMSVYLEISRNQSRECVLRAVCEAQLVADYYPDAPSSIFFEVLHLILKPSLSPTRDSCYGDYIIAEKAAYQTPTHCSQFISQCPLNIAGLFVRNFFPEIL